MTSKHSHDSSEEGWIPGLGENKPEARPLGKSLFGYVPDAYSMKSPHVPSNKTSRESSTVSSPRTSASKHRGEIIDLLTDQMSKVSITEKSSPKVVIEDIRVEQIAEQEAIPCDV